MISVSIRAIHPEVTQLIEVLNYELTKPIFLYKVIIPQLFHYSTTKQALVRGMEIER